MLKEGKVEKIIEYGKIGRPQYKYKLIQRWGLSWRKRDIRGGLLQLSRFCAYKLNEALSAGVNAAS
jgi:hypothetical protein